MEQQALIKAKQWLSSKNLDDAARKEVEAMIASTDKSQLIECFPWQTGESSHCSRQPEQ